MTRFKKTTRTVFSSACLLLLASAVSAEGITTSSSGEEVYQAFCKSCHSGGFSGWMTGAPEVGDKDDWKALSAKGLDALTASSIMGFGKMPAKGRCDVCSDAQVRATVEYMLEQSL